VLPGSYHGDEYSKLVTRFNMLRWI